MKFESVLFAVAFLVLAIISWPEEADSAIVEADASQRDAVTSQSANASQIEANDALR